MQHARLFLSFTISLSLLKLMSIESVIPPHHLILCHPLLLLPLLFPNIRVFFSELALRIRWPEYWSFSFSINPSNEYSELISFRIDWFDFLAVQGTLKSLLQHHTWKASSLIVLSPGFQGRGGWAMGCVPRPSEPKQDFEEMEVPCDRHSG